MKYRRREVQGAGVRRPSAPGLGLRGRGRRSGRLARRWPAPWAYASRALANSWTEPNRSAGFFAIAFRQTASSSIRDRAGIAMAAAACWSRSGKTTGPSPSNGSRPVSIWYRTTARLYWSEGGPTGPSFRQDLFRRHVGRRPRDLIGGGEPLSVFGAGQSEVRQEGFARTVEQDVGRLEVAVDDARHGRRPARP